MSEEQPEPTLVVSQVNFWRMAFAICLTSCIFLGAGLGLTTWLGLRMANTLAVYKDQCIHPSTAGRLTKALERVSNYNDLCIESHEQNISVLKKALPGLFMPKDRLHRWGIFAKGGEEDEQKPDENVPALSDRKARGGVLPD